MRLPPLNSVRAFEAAARHLSFKRAAEELFVTPAAVSYQIKILEDFLGIELFVRENRLVLLTQAGQRCYSDIKSGFEQIAKGIEKAQAEQKSGILTVSAGPAFTVKWLAPRLHEFVEQYPDIDARVSASLSFADLRHDNIDAAIRFGNIPKGDIAIEELMGEVAIPLCHPNLLTGSNGFNSPKALAQHTLIHDDSLIFNPKAPTWESCLREKGISEVDPSRGLRFNQADHALQAAIDGSGVILARRVLALPDIQAGRLVAPFPDWKIPTGMSYYFASLPEKASTYKVSAFRDWIKNVLFST